MGADSLAGLDENEEAACELVKTSLGYLRVLADDNEIQQDQAPPVVYTGSVGRPKFEITREQINFLVENGFTGPQIASLIVVSLSTVRRMVYFGLSIGAQYSSITVNLQMCTCKWLLTVKPLSTRKLICSRCS